MTEALVDPVLAGGGNSASPGPHDSVVVARFLLRAAASGGADARQLARDARLPGWALAASQAMIPSRYTTRLWELIEHSLKDPHAGLAIAGRHRFGELDLFDYLFTTAATVRAARQSAQDFMHLVSTNYQLRVEAETDVDVTYSHRDAEPGGRGEALGHLFAIALSCARAQAAARRRVIPAHVAFAHQAPPSHRVLAETLGTRRIDFAAPVTTITFRSRDLDLPLPGADPALARILHRFAATLSPPPVATWHDQFRRLLAETIDEGTLSLDVLARRLTVSRRTLQRQLAEHGTTWRAELAAERRRRAEAARQNGTADIARLARQLGYADARSASRALRRWRDQAP
jgi:AraC-like DNA-binding protein